MKENFKINMSKDEMLQFYANKIIEKALLDCGNSRKSVMYEDYYDGKYEYEILNLISKDERVADMMFTINGKEITFNTEFCPFYYEEQKDNDITNSPTYKAIMLAEFVDYIEERINLRLLAFSVRNAIKEYTNNKQLDEENRSRLSNLLKKSVIETGFVNKYLENTDAYITVDNVEELIKGLLEIIEKLDEKAKKNIESEELEEFE